LRIGCQYAASAIKKGGRKVGGDLQIQDVQAAEREPPGSRAHMSVPAMTGWSACWTGIIRDCQGAP
jgi:hypothetical protein